MTDKYTYINNIKIIRRVLKSGYDLALEFADGESEIAYTESLKEFNKQQLLNEIEVNKEKIMLTNSNREISPYVKHCIRKCEREFIPKNGHIDVYCRSCDRVLSSRLIKN